MREASGFSDLVDADGGTVAREVFVSPAVYEAELERIFARAWLLVGHESQVPNADDFEPCWPTLRAAFGEIRPAATMFVAALAKEEIKIEIEVTARRQSA